jgi:hypothetical protein
MDKRPIVVATPPATARRQKKVKQYGTFVMEINVLTDSFGRPPHLKFQVAHSWEGWSCTDAF